METEVLLLTGGASRRMGHDKAAIRVDGTPLAERIADAAASAGHAVTVLGRAPLPGHSFLADAGEHEGPAVALARVSPRCARAFVVACDLPGFDPRIIEAASARIGDRLAAVPVVGGEPQPLCALYTAEAFAVLRVLVAKDERKLRRWLDGIPWVAIDEDVLREAGLAPQCVLGANTPEELVALLAERDAACGETRRGV